jgi:hypothetical protein
MAEPRLPRDIIVNPDYVEELKKAPIEITG